MASWLIKAFPPVASIKREDAMSACQCQYFMRVRLYIKDTKSSVLIFKGKNRSLTKANQKYQTIKNQFDAIHHITNPFSAFMTTG